jgi:hypothetical protein
MKTSHVVVALILSASPLLYATQTTQPIPADLLQAANARDAAVDKIDVPAWDRLTAPEFTTVNETGHFMTRAERLAEFKKDKPRATPSVCAQPKNTMFANGTAAVRRCLGDGVWWTTVWTKTTGGWQVIAVQGTVAAK